VTAPAYTRRVFVGLTSSPKTPRASITWTELTDRMLSAQFRRGKSDLGGDFEPGSASIVLKNEDRMLDPDYDAGLVYRGDGNGLPGCPVKIVVTVGATDTILWFGYLGLEGWPVVRTVGVDSTVTLNAVTQTAWMATQALPSSPWAAGVIGLEPDWWIRGGADTTSLSGGDHLPDSISEGTTDQYAVVSGTGTVTIGSGLVNDDQDPAMEVGSGVRILSAGNDISPVTWGGGTGTKTQMVASCIWKADAQLVDHAVMSLFYDPTNHFRWRVYCDPYGQLVIVMTNAAGTVDLAFDVAPDNPADPDGRWDDGNPHIVTVKFVGSSKLSLWVDGQHVDLTTTVPTNYGYGDLLCGTTGGYSTIDEILWWNVAISDANILILHSWFLGTGAPLKGQNFAERAASLYELAGWVYDAAEEDDWHYVTGGGSPDPDLWGLGSVQSMPATLGEAQQQLVESYAGARWDTRAGWPRLRTAGALTDAAFAADYATAIANLTDEQSPAGSPTPIRRGLVQKSGTLLDRVVNKAVGTYGQDRGLGVPAEDLVSITRKTQSSIDLYGVRPAELTSQVTDGDYVAALVATAAAATAEPPVEIQAVEVEVNDADSLAFVVDDVELEKLLTVTDTPEVGDPWTADLQVQSEAHDWSPGRWVVTIGLALSQVRTGRARAVTSSVSAGIRIGGAGLLPGSVTAKALSPTVKAALGIGGASSTSAIPTGPAGGDLAGTYPNPTIGPGIVDIAKLAAAGTAHAGVAHLGDDTWGLPMPAPVRFAGTERTASLYYAKASGAVVKELWIGDSFAGYGASAAETTSMVAVYEKEMADLLNVSPRTVGFVPVKQMLSSGATYATSIEWDDISTTALSVRGPNYSNRKIESGEYAEVTREGTSVTIYYTAVRTGGAVVTVYINGSSVGTIDSTDGTIAASPGYDAGRSVSFSRPAAGLGDCLVRVEYTSGTAFDLEGAYFHNSNSGSGVQVLRGDKPGMAFSYMNDAANPSILQVIANNLPKVVTICLGINDANTSTTSYGGTYASPSDLASALTTMVGNIQAQYTTWMPTIRYVFQQDASVVPATWPTLYREAMMEACATLGVTFVDAHAAVGTLRSGDYLDVSDDSLHPNDYGSWVYGNLVADVAKRRTSGVYPRLVMQGSIYQTITGGALASVMHVRHQSGAGMYLGRYAGAASVNGNLLGAVGFEGELDAYGTPKLASAVRGVAEATWGATWKAGVQFQTTAATSLLVRGGFTGDGDFYVGATHGTGKLTVDTSGNTVVAGTFDVTGVATFTAQPIMSSLTASRAVFTDASKGLVSTATTGTGNVVLSAGPTLTGTITAAAANFSGAVDVAGAFSVATNKFTVANATGNTVVAGTLAVTGDVAVNTNKFTVAASSGNTAIAGTLTVTDNLISSAILAGSTSASGNIVIQSTIHSTRGLVKIKDRTIIGESVNAADAASGNPVMSITSAATNDDPTETVYQFRSQTTDAAPKNIGQIDLTAGSLMFVEATVVCHRNATSEVGGAWKVMGGYRDTGAGVPGLIAGSVTSAYSAASSTQTCTLVVSGTSVAIQVVGVAVQTYTWHATVRVYSVDT